MSVQQSYWRNKAAPIIAKVLADKADCSEQEIRIALRDAYPFGERKMHPYKIWCDEIRRQLGKKWPIGHKRAWENNLGRIKAGYKRLAEWERIYGKREAEE